MEKLLIVHKISFYFMLFHKNFQYIDDTNPIT
jgi:hypothetical protein